MLKLSKSIIMILSISILCFFSTGTVKAYTEWYELDQKITGYVGSNKTASGAYPIIGYVAVHCKEPIRYKGDTRALDPVIPFGTMITVAWGETIPTPGGNRSVFYVQDTGDTNHQRYLSGELSWFWLDVYVGADTPNNKTFAEQKLGGITRSYTWVSLD